VAFSVYISESQNPFVNLAAEHWLFARLAPPERILFLCVNEASVVIGRHQNPWLECNVPALRAEGIPLVRRQSGGGTVYHDPGNLNYSFLAGNEDYDQEGQFGVVIDALGDVGITAERSGRNDLLTQGKKVSGSAFKYKKDRSFHHGTLLLEADTERLHGLLHAAPREIESKGIASVRSPVLNLRELHPALREQELRRALIRRAAAYFGEEPQVLRLSSSQLLETEAVVEESQRLRTWDWVYGRTPDFREAFRFAITGHAGSRGETGPLEGPVPASPSVRSDFAVRFTVHRGRVQSVSLESSVDLEELGEVETDLQRVVQGLAYDPRAFRGAAELEATTWARTVLERIARWL
jgi:lipoate-protein ligase A